jgi:anti-sigma factor RsiW
VEWGTSWVAPVDIRRVETRLTDSQVAEVSSRRTGTAPSPAQSGSRRQSVWTSAVPGRQKCGCSSAIPGTAHQGRCRQQPDVLRATQAASQRHQRRSSQARRQVQILRTLPVARPQ